MSFNFNLPKKFFVNNSFYLLPITVLLYLMYNGFSKDITFAQKEIYGADINENAITLLAKAVSNNLNHESVQKDSGDLLEKYAKYSVGLNFSSEEIKAKGKESILKDALQKSIQDLSNEKINHAESMTALNDLISYVGDSSNLILDPDLDTYYLMDATIYAVPQLINRLNNVNSFLESNKESLASLSAKESMKLNTLIEIITSVDMPRLTGDVNTSLKEDKNFHETNSKLQGDVKKLISNLEVSGKAYLAVLQKINSAENFTADELKSARQKFSDDLLAFEFESIEVLKAMLTTRVEGIQSARIKALGTGIFSVIIALLVSFFITKTIRLDLGRLISKLRESSDEVDNTSKHNSGISTELSSAVVEQAASVQEISATTEEISQMTQRNNENVKVSMAATSETMQTVVTANQLMTELSNSITELKNGNDRIIERSDLNSKNFESIIGIMKTIEDKTKVINDIVFQTKLLSFNASVEAARAGEQGKGFAVVAEEVGKLASMSGTAAQEISELLDSSLKKVKELTVEADLEIKKVVDISTANISVAVEKVSYCQSTNQKILTNSEKTNQLISEVVTASEEQTKGVIEITKAIGSFDVVTERNSQLASDLSNSAKLLSAKSGELKDVIGSLMDMAGNSN